LERIARSTCHGSTFSRALRALDECLPPCAGQHLLMFAEELEQHDIRSASGAGPSLGLMTCIGKTPTRRFTRGFEHFANRFFRGDVRKSFDILSPNNDPQCFSLFVRLFGFVSISSTSCITTVLLVSPASTRPPIAIRSVRSRRHFVLACVLVSAFDHRRFRERA